MNLNNKKTYSFALLMIFIVIYLVTSPSKVTDNLSRYISSQKIQNKNIQKSSVVKYKSPKKILKIKRTPSSPDRNAGRVTPKYISRPVLTKPPRRQAESPIIDGDLALIDYESEPFESGGKEYSRVKNMYAIKKNTLSAPPANYIAEMNGYYLMSDEGSEYAGNNDALTVVKNEKNGNLVVFTGILRLKLFNYQADALSIIDQVNNFISQSNSPNTIVANIDEQFEYIKIITYKFDNYESTMRAAAILRNEQFISRVERVSIDLIEWQRLSN